VWHAAHAGDQQLGQQAANSGIDLQARTLVWMRDNHPADFAKLLRVFPMAEAQIVRGEMYPETLPQPKAKKGKHRHTAGGKTSPEYRSWAAMVQRCTNPKHKHYADYGGRGVTVCERYRDSKTGFASFLEDVSTRPEGMTLDRADTERGYEPGNVRWSTRKVQQRNRRVSRMVEIDGVTKVLAAWCEEYGMAPNVVSGRLKRGWEPKAALETPVRGAS
jgi:hypothetical protein